MTDADKAAPRTPAASDKPAVKQRAAKARKQSQKQRRTPQEVLHATLPKLLRVLVGCVVPAMLGLPFVLTASGVEFYKSHVTYAAAPLVVVVVCLAYGFNNYSRTHPPKDKNGKPRRQPRPAKRALGRVIADATDIIANLDKPGWRVFYALSIVASIVLPIIVPVSIPDVQAFREHTQAVLISGAVPVLLTAVILGRQASIMRERMAWIETVYAVARDSFDYKPLPERGTITARQRITATPHLAVDVRKWKTLTEGDVAFVWVPEKVSATEVKMWDEFTANLEEKAPRPEEWRIRTQGQQGRGAIVGPANYPRAVLWDGWHHPDPLTFKLGVDLETGEDYIFTFNDASPHMAVSGGTSTGKTSGAEIVAVQALVKPMPWDPELRAQVHFIDPKGPLARRWQGRPGVVVSNGQADSEVHPPLTNEDGDEISPFTGVLLMSEHLKHIEAEHQRRANVLARFPDVGTWMALPHSVLREEKFFPMFVVLDEYLDHTDLEKVKDNGRIEAEDAARAATTRMAAWHARKYRNVGMHTMLIAQEVKMTGNTGIGSNLMRNLAIRIITGQMDLSQVQTMFGTTEVPRLPSSYRKADGTTKTIPGRARVMNAMGQSIRKIQIMWFGGPTNSETLDKWLPRGDKPLNGDFSLPTNTRPRTAADFDEDGNFIGPEATANAEAPEAEVDQNEAPEEAEERAPHDVAVEASSDDEVAPVEAQEPAPERPTPALDAGGVFTAVPSTQGCTHPQCSVPSSWTCPLCSTQYCDEHGARTRNPDVESEQRYVCGACAAAHPLVKVGLASLIPDITTKTRRLRLVCTYEIKEDESGAEYGEMLIRGDGEAGKKIVQVYSRAQPGSPDGGFSYRARSASGMVEGLSAVRERVDTAVDTFVRNRLKETTVSVPAGGAK